MTLIIINTIYNRERRSSFSSFENPSHNHQQHPRTMTCPVPNEKQANRKGEQTCFGINTIPIQPLFPTGAIVPSRVCRRSLQGSCCVGIKSKTHAILGVLKRSPSELASYQEKLFKMDSHLVISISGLTADARYLSDHMRMECLNHRFVYGASLQVGRLVSHISDMHQRCTQDMTYERGRPFGVGLLVAGYDKTGPHIYETSPTAHYYEHKAQAIGARSQAQGRTEKVFETFPDLSVDELVIHALKSLEGAAGDKDLTAESVGIAIVGKDQDVKLLSTDELKSYLSVAFGSSTEGSKAVSSDDVEMKEA